MRHRDSARPAALLSCLCGVALLAGCSDGGRLWSYRNNPTPEMNTLAMTVEEERNRDAIVNDTMGRSFNEDGARALHTDRPSRMIPRRVPY